MSLQYNEDGVSVIHYGNLEIDSRCRRVVINNKEINLRLKEFDILYLLIRHPGWVYTKEQIFNSVYGEELSMNIDNILYCLVYGLRKKLKIDSKQPEYIQTVRGIGYKFMIPEE